MYFSVHEHFFCNLEGNNSLIERESCFKTQLGWWQSAVLWSVPE